MKNFTSRILVSLFLLLISSVCYSQSQKIEVKGKVTNENGKPIALASIYLHDNSNFTYSQDDGSYKMLIDYGDAVITASFVGYVDRTYKMNFEKRDSVITLNFILKEESLEIDDITVQAEIKDSKDGTSVYEIKEQAIKQVQAKTLGDILSLLPGKKVGTTSLNSVQEANLRTATSNSMNNFGTSIMVDGAVMSNDANMQADSPATSMGSGEANVGGGIDLRTISAASIEKVSVVTGVASPKYGNLSSGLVLVTSKVGVTPFYVTANLNPGSYQFALTKGVDLGKAGQLSTNLAYTYSDASNVDKKNYFNNINGGLRWRTRINEKLDWYNTTSFTLNYSKNGQYDDPDDFYKNTSNIVNSSYGLTVNGNLNLLGKLSYNLSATASSQLSEQVSTQTNGPLPLVSGLETGYYFGGYSTLVYPQETIMTGLPVNVNGSIDADQSLKVDDFSFSFSTGLQYSFSKNYGEGRVVDGAVSGLTTIAASRSTNFYEVPATNIISLYHQSTIQKSGDNSFYELRLGARYDNMYFKYNLLSPRLAFQAKYFDKYRVRASYGVSYKAPAMIQLYPGPTYIDNTVMSHYTDNPDERMAIVYTYVYQPDNSYLKPTRGDMFELGLDYFGDKFQVQLTGYMKSLTDGVGYTDQMRILNIQNYEVVERPVGEMPIVEAIPDSYDRVVNTYGLMQNNQESKTYGIELTLTPPKIEATNTQLDFRLSYMMTEAYNNSDEIRIEKYSVDSDEIRFGVYNPSPTRYYVSSANLTLVQHIPSLRLAVTLISELNFVDYRDYLDKDIYAKAYYDASGEYHVIPESDRASSEYENLQLSASEYDVEKTPFYPNFHLNIRKETKMGHSFSLYANNAFWLRKQYTYKEHVRTIESLVTFGFSVSFMIGGH